MYQAAAVVVTFWIICCRFLLQACLARPVLDDKPLPSAAGKCSLLSSGAGKLEPPKWATRRVTLLRIPKKPEVRTPDRDLNDRGKYS